jgi:hypothetical protein
MDDGRGSVAVEDIVLIAVGSGAGAIGWMGYASCFNKSLKPVVITLQIGNTAVPLVICG